MNTSWKGNKTWIFFLIGAVLTIISPALLTQTAYFSWLDLTANSNIGDTIGGITAPIVGLLGAWLLYVTIMEQRKANKINMIYNSLNELDNYIAQNEILVTDVVIYDLIENYTSVVKDPVPLKVYAWQKYYTILNVSFQIHSISNEIESSYPSSLKGRIVLLTYLIKESNAYKAVNTTRIFSQIGDKNYSPETMLAEVDGIIKKWDIEIPHTKNIDPLKCDTTNWIIAK